MNITESLVSSSILLVLVASSTSLYMNSLGALQNSRARDGVSAFINNNLEDIRNNVEEFRAAPVNGMLKYEPVSTPTDTTPEADTTQMGLNFIIEKAGLVGTGVDEDEDDIYDYLEDEYTGDEYPGITVTRTITADPDQPYLVKVIYTTQGNAKVSPEHSSEIMFPAQAWLP